MGKEKFTLAGVIDVGTHALRLTIAQINEDGKIAIIEDLVKATDIGSDTFSTGRIGLDTMKETVVVLKGFAQTLKGYKVKNYRAISTSALREAENRDYILEHIRLKTGIEVEVINRAQERFYTYKALRYQSPGIKLTNSEEATLVVNVASGGVEISIYEKGSLRLTEYLNVGALRIHETLSELRHKTADFDELIEEYFNSKIAPLRPMLNNPNLKYLIGLGSELNEVFSCIRSGHDHFVDKEAVTVLYEKVRGISDAQLSEMYHLTARQVETFLPSVIILNAFIKLTQTKRVYVPMVTLRDGLLYDIADEVYAPTRRQEYSKDIVSSVWYIAKKFGVDRPHSAQVAKLSLSIFDQTLSLHRLGERERIYLQIAAILHAIGNYVSFSEHTMMSYHLIKKQNIMGLSNEELNLIANIVRYHESEVPNQYHLDYQGLSHENKITVAKLSAILKLGDSLDVSRQKKVDGIDIKRENDVLSFKLKTKQNLVLESWSFARGAGFFEEIMGVRPWIRTS